MNENTERTCYDCHNFRAKIPLGKKGQPTVIKNAREILPLKINYKAATARCRCGHILHNTGERDREFKNVLRPIAQRYLLAYQAAIKCPDYYLDD